MEGNGQLRKDAADGAVLRWSGRVLAAEDLRRSLNGHRELLLAPQTVITPLAAEELRAGGIRITRQQVETHTPARPAWGYAQERPHALVTSAVQSLRRDGLALRELAARPETSACRWAQAVAECIMRGDCQGGVIFCDEPGLVCCVANKLAGLRAVAVGSVNQAARGVRALGANVVVVEMPGRTFFEVRQILRTVCAGGKPACPPGVACTLKELDGHAHR
jgi:ribose 5-phosphate isomerase RpiB